MPVVSPFMQEDRVTAGAVFWNFGNIGCKHIHNLLFTPKWKELKYTNEKL